MSEETFLGFCGWSQKDRGQAPYYKFLICNFSGRAIILLLIGFKTGKHELKNLFVYLFIHEKLLNQTVYLKMDPLVFPSEVDMI